MDAKEEAIRLAKRFKGFEMPNEEIASKQCALEVVSVILDYIRGKGYHIINEEHRDDYNFYTQVYYELEKNTKRCS